jgi:hypothetical protein
VLLNHDKDIQYQHSKINHTLFAEQASPFCRVALVAQGSHPAISASASVVSSTLSVDTWIGSAVSYTGLIISIFSQIKLNDYYKRIMGQMLVL